MENKRKEGGIKGVGDDVRTWAPRLSFSLVSHLSLMITKKMAAWHKRGRHQRERGGNNAEGKEWAWYGKEIKVAFFMLMVKKNQSDCSCISPDKCTNHNIKPIHVYTDVLFVNAFILIHDKLCERSHLYVNLALQNYEILSLFISPHYVYFLLLWKHFAFWISCIKAAIQINVYHYYNCTPVKKSCCMLMESFPLWCCSHYVPNTSTLLNSKTNCSVVKPYVVILNAKNWRKSCLKILKYWGYLLFTVLWSDFILVLDGQKRRFKDITLDFERQEKPFFFSLTMAPSIKLYNHALHRNFFSLATLLKSVHIMCGWNILYFITYCTLDLIFFALLQQIYRLIDFLKPFMLHARPWHTHTTFSYSIPWELFIFNTFGSYKANCASICS